MGRALTIGQVARRTGIPATTIRYYESEGVVSPPARTEAGYRLYSAADVRQLQLAQRARLIGLSVDEVRRLVATAFEADCDTFVGELLEGIERQRAQVAARIAELRALEATLETLERRVRAECACDPGQTVAECDCCPLIDDEEGGEQDD